jgi:chromosome segregation ATPase
MASTRYEQEHERITEESGNANYINHDAQLLIRELSLLPRSFSEPLLLELDHLKVTPGKLETHLNSLEDRVKSYWLSQLSPLSTKLKQLDLSHTSEDLKDKVKKLCLKTEVKKSKLYSYRKPEPASLLEDLLNQLQKSIDELTTEVNSIEKQVIDQNILWAEKKENSIQLAKRLLLAHPQSKPLSVILQKLDDLKTGGIDEINTLREQLNEIFRRDNEAELAAFGRAYAARARRDAPKSARTSCWSCLFGRRTEPAKNLSNSAHVAPHFKQS